MEGDTVVACCDNEHDLKDINQLPSCEDDLTSGRPTLFQRLKRKAPADGINWKRLKGYSLPTDDKKKTSWVWKHGWRVVDESDHEYWLCKACHQHWYTKGCLYRTEKSTSSALDHTRIKHKLTETGPVVESKPQVGRTKSLAAFRHNITTGIKADGPGIFACSTFQTLLYNWIVADNVSFRKVESPHFHALLRYLNPRCERLLPSHQTISRTIGEIYDKQLGTVTETLRAATTKIDFSFDLWTSKNRLALLGLVAHFIDNAGCSRSILLALPRQKGRHTGANIADTVAEIICHYDLQKRIGYFISDNARNNSKALDFLASGFTFDPHRRWLRCVGHIFNLCGQAVLFGKDFDAFEREVQDLQLEELQLVEWRRRGPIGKLHNILMYLEASPQRWEELVKLQRELIAPIRPEGEREVYQIMKSVIIRWNSFDDSAERALYLRPAIDELIQREQDGWDNYVRRTQESGRSATRTEPSIVRDKLSGDEWTVIERYREILKPLKDATKLLQGSAGGKFGAIWQVLPTFEKRLSHFESLRVQYPIAETISSVEDTLITPQHHFTTSINLGWQKLNEYYNKLDETPVYVAAVVLHPRMKWRYLEKRWADEEWLMSAKKAFSSLWLEYATTDRHLRRHKTSRRTSPSPKAESLAAMMLSNDESSDDDGSCDVDQLAQYLAEPRHPTLSLGDSPIPYWIGNRGRWPDLASMALDIFVVPAMSDAPERVFSTADDVLSPRRRLLHSETLGWLMTEVVDQQRSRCAGREPF